MKIIQKGDINKLKAIKRFTCDRCGCIFEADNTEYKTHSDQREGTYYQVICPYCNKIIYS